MNPKSILGLLCCGVLAIAQPCPSAGVQAGRLISVLAVGVDAYQRAPGFEGAARDVGELSEAISKKWCVPPTNITVLKDANRISILLAYTGALSRMSQNGTLILIFVGHGFEIDGDQYLVPSDAFVDERSLEAAASASISLKVMKRIAREYSASNVVYILDVCRTFPLRVGTRTTVFYGALEGMRSYEINGRGLFLPKLTATIRGSAALPFTNFLKIAQVVTENLSSEGVSQSSSLVVDVPSPSPPPGKKPQRNWSAAAFDGPQQTRFDEAAPQPWPTTLQPIVRFVEPK